MEVGHAAIAAMQPTEFESLDAFVPVKGPEIQRWSTSLDRGSRFEALGVNKGSDTLVVSLHGSTNRSKYQLPRFEWLASLSTVDCSSLYFSDPTLRLSTWLELGWYTGWEGFDGHYWVAEWSKRVAEQFGCSTIIFAGASGGGMASLQASSYVPDSMAVAFNPQTSIINYHGGGKQSSAQMRYFKVVAPQLLPGGGWETKDSVEDWTAPLGDAASVVKRYSRPQSNYVYYVQNENDLSHLEGHFQPFKNQVKSVLSDEDMDRRFQFEMYDGPAGHVAPSRGQYLRHLGNARAWLETRR